MRPRLLSTTTLLLAAILGAGCKGAVDTTEADASASLADAGVGDGSADASQPKDALAPGLDGGPEDADASDADASDPECAALARMTLGDVTWSTPTIAPGDQANLAITLTNDGADDFNYPGMTLSSDSSGVSISPSNNVLFGIRSGQAVPMNWVVTFGAALPHGTTIQFRAQATALHHPPCPGAGSIQFAVTLS